MIIKLLFFSILIFYFYFWWFWLSYDLKITEIFYDWTDEWIEIYNNWEDFNWNFILSWVKSTNLNINNIKILSWNSIIIWDDLEFIIDKSNYITWQKLSISDSSEIKINIVYSWSILDEFYINSDLVNQYNNKYTSFSKIFSWWNWMTTPVLFDQVYNITGIWIANPGKVILNEFINNNLDWCNLTWDDFIMWISNYICNDNIDYFSWNNDIIYSAFNNCNIDLSSKKYIWSWIYDISLSISWMDTVYCSDQFVHKWNINSKNINWDMCWLNNVVLSWENKITYKLFYNENLLCESYFNFYTYYNYEIISPQIQNELWKIIITEINPYDDKFPEYIELKSIWNYSWYLEIWWLWHWSYKKWIDLKTYSWNYIILTDSYSWFIDTWNVYLFDSIFLTDLWEELIVLWQSWLIMDSIEYLSSSRWKSVYFTDYSWDYRIFKNIENYTPLFDEKNKQYFNLDIVDSNYCYVKIQNKDPFYFWNSINLISVLNDKELENSNDNYICIWSLGNWTNLTWCNLWYFEYLNIWIYKVDLNIYNNEKLICSTSSFINYPEKQIIKTYLKKPTTKDICKKIEDYKNSIKDLKQEKKTLKNKISDLNKQIKQITKKFDQKIKNIEKKYIKNDKNNQKIIDKIKNKIISLEKKNLALNTKYKDKIEDYKNEKSKLKQKINDLKKDIKTIKTKFNNQKKKLEKNIKTIKNKNDFINNYISFIDDSMKKNRPVIYSKDMKKLNSIYKKFISKAKFDDKYVYYNSIPVENYKFNVIKSMEEWFIPLSYYDKYIYYDSIKKVFSKVNLIWLYADDFKIIKN